MDELETFIHDNLEMIQKTSVQVLNVLMHAFKKLSIFAEIEGNNDQATYRRRWLDIFVLIDSERKEILRDQTDKELAKTNKKMAQQNVQGSTNEDIEAGAPEPRPDNGNTKSQVSKPSNRRKDNEKNQINGAKTKKRK